MGSSDNAFLVLFDCDGTLFLGDDPLVSPRDAAAGLDALQADGFGALLTERPEALARSRFEQLGLSRFFAAGPGAFGSETEGANDLYRLALERAQTPPQRAVRVADNRSDLRCAEAPGIYLIVVSRDPDPSGSRG